VGVSGDTRDRIAGAFSASIDWERDLTQRLVSGLARIPDVTIHGIADTARFHRRVPTVSFTHSRLSPPRIAAALAAANVFVWSGNNFALEVVRSLGLDEDEGVVRIGMGHYNTPAEIDRTLDVLDDILKV